jgi:hypothetical protein
MQLTRDRIITALVSALEQLDFVNAVWQGGAAAFDRVDQWSDIDLCIDANDDRCDDVWPVVDAAIATLSPVEICFNVPNPPLGLRSQRFYWLRDAGPFLLLDIDVFAASAKDKLLDPAVHGNAVVHFDRTGVTKVSTDSKTRQASIKSRLEQLKQTVPLFQSLVDKEINRGNDIEAIAFYHAWSVRPLVELLRMKYCPQRYQFHTRYVQYDLPKEIVDRLRPFFFVRDLGEIKQRRAEVERWCKQLLVELDRSV